MAQALVNVASDSCRIHVVFFYSNQQPDKINVSIHLSEPEQFVCLPVFFVQFHELKQQQQFSHKIHYSRYFMLFSVLKRTSFFTPNRHGYSVQFSPFEANILAVGKSGKCAPFAPVFNYYAFPIIQSLSLLLLLLSLCFILLATSKPFGFVGGGTLFLLHLNESGAIVRTKSFEWSDGLFDTVSTYTFIINRYELIERECRTAFKTDNNLLNNFRLHSSSVLVQT